MEDLDKKEITEIKAFMNPPHAFETVLNCIVIFRGRFGIDIVNPKTYFLGNNDSNNNNIPTLKNSSFYCSVTSGISDEGNFWMQLNFNDTDTNNNVDSSLFRASNVKINMFIEEMSKFTRRKRIGDKEWLTYQVTCCGYIKLDLFILMLIENY